MQICHSSNTHLVQTADQQKLLQPENVILCILSLAAISKTDPETAKFRISQITHSRQARSMSNTSIFLASLPPHKQFSFSFFSLPRWDYRCVHHPVDAVQGPVCSRQAHSWATLPPKSSVSLVFIRTVLDCFQTFLENQLGSTQGCTGTQSDTETRNLCSLCHDPANSVGGEHWNQPMTLQLPGASLSPLPALKLWEPQNAAWLHVEEVTSTCCWPWRRWDRHVNFQGTAMWTSRGRPSGALALVQPLAQQFRSVPRKSPALPLTASRPETPWGQAVCLWSLSDSPRRGLADVGVF